MPRLACTVRLAVIHPQEAFENTVLLCLWRRGQRLPHLAACAAARLDEEVAPRTGDKRHAHEHGQRRCRWARPLHAPRGNLWMTQWATHWMPHAPLGRLPLPRRSTGRACRTFSRVEQSMQRQFERQQLHVVCEYTWTIWRGATCAVQCMGGPATARARGMCRGGARMAARATPNGAVRAQPWPKMPAASSRRPGGRHDDMPQTQWTTQCMTHWMT